MKRRSLRTFLILLLATTGLASTVVASPATVRIDTPGSAFRVVLGKGTVSDAPDGRRIKGAANAEVTLAGVLVLPAAGVAERRASRLVLHFRTSKSGPTLRSITLPDGNRVELNLSGDFPAEAKRNTLDFGDIPIKLYDRSILKLVIGFPGGFEGNANPGEFVLKNVSLDYLKCGKC